MKKNVFFSGHRTSRCIALLLALWLVAVFLSPLQAQEEEGQSKEKPEQQVMQMIQQFEKRGFSRIGPLQVTRLPADGVVGFYRHDTVRYDQIQVVNERGDEADLDKYDRVYLLQNDEQVILIRLNKEDRSNA